MRMLSILMQSRNNINMTDNLAIEECTRTMELLILKLKRQELRIKQLEDNLKCNFSTFDTYKMLDKKTAKNPDIDMPNLDEEIKCLVEEAYERMSGGIKKIIDANKSRLSMLKTLGAPYDECADELSAGQGSSSYEDLVKQEAMKGTKPEIYQYEQYDEPEKVRAAEQEVMKGTQPELYACKKYGDLLKQESLSKKNKVHAAEQEIMNGARTDLYEDLVKQEAKGTKKNKVHDIEQETMKGTHQELYECKQYEDLVKREAKGTKKNKVDDIEQGLMRDTHQELYECKQYEDMLREEISSSSDDEESEWFWLFLCIYRNHDSSISIGRRIDTIQIGLWRHEIILRLWSHTMD